MGLSFMQNDLVLALCWTLIHSLWQGLLLAIVTGAILIATRKSHAGKRYGVLTFLFFLFMIVTAVTFVRELNLAATGNAAAASVNAVAHDQLSVAQTVYTDNADIVAGKSLLDKFKDYFNTHASLIVMIWFIIFIARFIKLTAGLAYVQRLKHYKTSKPSDEWKNRINELILSLGIKKQIQLLESGIIKVPLVMGVLKPVILLPAGLLAHLPADEIEAILLHELAHIKRRDYFVNLLQSFAETLFFFNPALMWLSSVIREERENCCDDIAISVTNNKTKFIDALISFQEYDLSAASYSVGFTGKKNQLLNRVKRIINNKNKTLNATEKSLLTFGMGVLILFSFAAAKKISPIKEKQPELKTGFSKQFAANGDQKHIMASASVTEHLPAGKAETVSAFSTSYSPERHEFIDTFPARKIATASHSSTSTSSYSDTAADRFTSMSTSANETDQLRTLSIAATRKDGKTIKFTKVNDALTELYINNQQISEKDFKEYSADIAEIENFYQFRKEESKRKRELAEIDRRERTEMKRIKMSESRDIETKKRIMEETQNRIAMNNKRISFEKSKMARDTAIQSMKFEFRLRDSIANEIRAKSDPKVNGEWRRVLRDFDKLSDSMVRLRSVAERQAYLSKQDAIRIRQADDDIQIRVSADKMRNIIADLEKEGIKIDLQKSWFALDKNQFVVDGKNMSPELHQKFREKFIRSSDGWGYYYGPVQVHGTGVFLDYKNLSR